MNSPEKFLNGFAKFVQQKCALTLHCYAGYAETSGSLLIKTKDTQIRVAFRPWLRHGPVGLQDVMRSNERYREFKGQQPSVHVHIAGKFRDNALRYAMGGNHSTVISLGREPRSVEVVGSRNLPKPVFDALLAFCNQHTFNLTFDFVGTIVQKSLKSGVVDLDSVTRSASHPKLFISYSWDNDAHRRWVLKLAADLIRNGVKVLIDEWDLKEFNDDLYLFMETSIRESDYVVLVCTPKYAVRANSRKGGVGVESTIVTGEFYDLANKGKKFIPITRHAKGGPEHCLPTYLKSRYAIDFTEEAQYHLKLDELLRRLFSQPRYRRPELGPVPKLESEDV